MVKDTVKKILAVILFMIIILAIISNQNYCFALGDVTDSDGAWGKWVPSETDSGGLNSKISPILGAIQVIGIMVSVGTLSVIGIKFMLGSVEEKANYKQAMIPWCLGAVMIFAVTFVPALIYDVTTPILRVEKTYHTTGTYEKRKVMKDRIEGYDNAIEEAYEWYETNSESLTEGSDTWKLFKKRIEMRAGSQQSLGYSKEYQAGYAAFMGEISPILDKKNPEEFENFYKGNNSAKADIEQGKITIDNVGKKTTEIDPKSSTYNLAKYKRLIYQREYWIVAVGKEDIIILESKIEGYEEALEEAYEWYETNLESLTEGSGTWELFKKRTAMRAENQLSLGKNNDYVSGYAEFVEEINKVLDDKKPEEFESFYRGHHSAKGDITKGEIRIGNIDEKISETNPEGSRYDLGRYKRLVYQKNLWLEMLEKGEMESD